MAKHAAERDASSLLANWHAEDWDDEQIRLAEEATWTSSSS